MGKGKVCVCGGIHRVKYVWGQGKGGRHSTRGQARGKGQGPKARQTASGKEGV